MMNNYKIRDLEDKMIDTLNSSDVAIEAKRLIVQNLLNMVTKQADARITMEIQDMKKEED
jgi:hypothetical protein